MMTTKVCTYIQDCHKPLSHPHPDTSQPANDDNLYRVAIISTKPGKEKEGMRWMYTVTADEDSEKMHLYRAASNHYLKNRQPYPGKGKEGEGDSTTFPARSASQTQPAKPSQPMMMT